jgi:hypothetical protein
MLRGCFFSRCMSARNSLVYDYCRVVVRVNHSLFDEVVISLVSVLVAC